MGKIVVGVVGIVIVTVLIITFSIYHFQYNYKTSENYYLQNVPPKPDDFDLIRREIETGYVDLSDLKDNYYLQPDFYPGWAIGQKFYIDHDYSRWGVYGHGAYPANPEIIFTTKNVGDWINFITFYKAGYGIETWQGIRLVSSENKYFDLKIEPEEFLLEPTFPFFREGWVYPISITVIIKEQPNPGIYIININAVPPSEQKRKEWFWKVIREESTVEEQFMVKQLMEQYDGEIPENYEGWITFERKNKYVDASVFQMSNRIQLKIVVE